MPHKLKLVVMAAPGQSTDILINWLSDTGFPPTTILMEPAQSRLALLRGRWRKLGLRAMLGQLAFMAVVPPLLRRHSAIRRAAILHQHALRTTPLNEDHLMCVPSINDPEVVEILQHLNPDVVILSGTRIVKPATLAAASAPVLNIHAGITPAYRGVHGGYWALWEGKLQEFGSTLHLVDPGVDTGAIIAQLRLRPSAGDNFTTYPLLQLAAALPALTACLEQIGQGQSLSTQPAPNGPSRQWYHPTLWQYLAGRLSNLR